MCVCPWACVHVCVHVPVCSPEPRCLGVCHQHWIILTQVDSSLSMVIYSTTRAEDWKAFKPWATFPPLKVSEVWSLWGSSVSTNQSQSGRWRANGIEIAPAFQLFWPGTGMKNTYTFLISLDKYIWLHTCYFLIPKDFMWNPVVL